MSAAREVIDVGVRIDRVRVRVRPREADASPIVEPPRPQRARAGDHRILVGELLVETDAALEAFEARSLGERVARALGEGLATLQARRLDAVLARRSCGGPVHISALRVVLRGAEAERPDVRAVAMALTGAVERRLQP